MHLIRLILSNKKKERKKNMPTEKHFYRVTYCRGLGTPTVFEATCPQEARKMALAEYRRNVTMLDEKPMDMVVTNNVEDLGPVE